MKQILCYKILLFSLFISPVKAKESGEKQQVNKPLNLAFLEYLADMKEVNGQLLGPQDMLINGDVKSSEQPQTPLTKEEAKQGENIECNAEIKECKSHD